MELDILITEQNKINFAPKNIYEEVIQNVKTICTTTKYSVPLDRRFGINADFLDRPAPKARAMLQAEIISAIREYEPRCKVKKIIIDENLDGKLNMKLRIEIK